MTCLDCYREKNQNNAVYFSLEEMLRDITIPEIGFD